MSTLKETPYVLIEDLAALSQPLLEGTFTRTLHRDAHVVIGYFAFAPGEGLSEHTSTKPATLHILRGDAVLTLGDDTVGESRNVGIHACLSQTQCAGQDRSAIPPYCNQDFGVT